MSCCACFYSWGSNSFGQLGFPSSRSGAAGAGAGAGAASPPQSGGGPALVHQASFSSSSASGDDCLELRPRHVASLVTLGVVCTGVACGERHTSVVTDTGAVWSWGSGETHQMGIFDNVDQFNPVQAQTLGKRLCADTEQHSICSCNHMF